MTKTIYIKTEPAGYIAIGQLSEEQVRLLNASCREQQISQILLGILENTDGSLEECEGVFVSGSVGDTGNEGVIADAATPTIGVPQNADGSFQDGVFVVNMQLSKCSISFQFDPGSIYDPALLEEISTTVLVPEAIRHWTYGHPCYRVVTGYSYDGIEIEEGNDPENFINRGMEGHIISL